MSGMIPSDTRNDEFDKREKKETKGETKGVISEGKK